MKTDATISPFMSSSGAMAAVEMISNGVIAVADLVTHIFPFSRAQEAFTLFADRTDGVIKVMLAEE